MQLHLVSGHQKRRNPVSFRATGCGGRVAVRLDQKYRQAKTGNSNGIIKWLLLQLFVQLFGVTACCNVYIVIYATADGRTGHAGIAIDNYQVHILGDKEDTVADGTLTYFDLWP